MLLYVGQFDVICGIYGVEKVLELVRVSEDFRKSFWESPRNLYYYDDADGAQRVGGYSKSHRNLELLVVFGAGHLVPTSQMEISRSFLRDYIGQ